MLEWRGLGNSIGCCLSSRINYSQTSIKVVKVKLKIGKTPTFDTVCDIWYTAEFHEREVFDFFGIKFTNHPNLKDSLTEEWDGFPLRKDYVDEINMVIK